MPPAMRTTYIQMMYPTLWKKFEFVGKIPFKDEDWNLEVRFRLRRLGVVDRICNQMSLTREVVVTLTVIKMEVPASHCLAKVHSMMTNVRLVLD
jgi:hypothetical protein